MDRATRLLATGLCALGLLLAPGVATADQSEPADACVNIGVAADEVDSCSSQAWAESGCEPPVAGFTSHPQPLDEGSSWRDDSHINGRMGAAPPGDPCGPHVATKLDSGAALGPGGLVKTAARGGASLGPQGIVIDQPGAGVTAANQRIMVGLADQNPPTALCVGWGLVVEALIDACAPHRSGDVECAAAVAGYDAHPSPLDEGDSFQADGQLTQTPIPGDPCGPTTSYVLDASAPMGHDLPVDAWGAGGASAGSTGIVIDHIGAGIVVDDARVDTGANDAGLRMAGEKEEWVYA